MEVDEPDLAATSSLTSMFGKISLTCGSRPAFSPNHLFVCIGDVIVCNGNCFDPGHHPLGVER